MAFVVAERTFPEPQTADRLWESIREGAGCNALYGITHLGSLLGGQGRRVVCFYRAPDAEVVRGVSRQQQLPYDRVWSATLHGQGAEPLTSWGSASNEAGRATVMVSRAFAAPMVFDDLQAQEDAQRWCLQQHRVQFIQSLFSLDRKRMLCLYAAPDAEAVRHAQRGAGLPFEEIMTMTVCVP